MFFFILNVELFRFFWQTGRQEVRQRRVEHWYFRVCTRQQGRLYTFIVNYGQNMELLLFRKEQPGCTYFFSPLSVHKLGVVTHLQWWMCIRALACTCISWGGRKKVQKLCGFTSILLLGWWQWTTIHMEVNFIFLVIGYIHTHTIPTYLLRLFP